MMYVFCFCFFVKKKKKKNYVCAELMCDVRMCVTVYFCKKYNLFSWSGFTTTVLYVVDIVNCLFTTLTVMEEAGTVRSQVLVSLKPHYCIRIGEVCA